jgi:hypothetical protein
LCGNASVGIEATKRAVALLEDTGSFLDEGLDVVDELFFVQLVFGSAVGGFDVLRE